MFQKKGKKEKNANLQKAKSTFLKIGVPIGN